MVLSLNSVSSAFKDFLFSASMYFFLHFLLVLLQLYEVTLISVKPQILVLLNSFILLPADGLSQISVRDSFFCSLITIPQLNTADAVRKCTCLKLKAQCWNLEKNNILNEFLIKFCFKRFTHKVGIIFQFFSKVTANFPLLEQALICIESAS